MTTLTIPGEPTPKGRPRFSCIKGKPHTYTPAKTLAAEQEIGWHLRSAHSGPAMTGDVHVAVTFYCKSKTSDADNLLKCLLDAANGIVFEDDRQVTSVHLKLIRVAKDPHTVVQFTDATKAEVAA